MEHILGSAPARLRPPSRAVNAADVEEAASRLLRAGIRPTIDKVRQAIGRGSPNTLSPLLEAWWRQLGALFRAERPDPNALARLPESVALAAERLFLEALLEARERAQQESATLTESLESQKRRWLALAPELKDRDQEQSELLRDFRNLARQLREELAYWRATAEERQRLADSALRRLKALQQVTRVSPAAGGTARQKPIRRPLKQGARKLKSRSRPQAAKKRK